MDFQFKNSERLSIGVEIELQILDPETLDLAPESERLLAICKEQKIERVKAEIHQSMLEIDSEISSTVKECRKYLKLRMEGLNEIAERSGLRIGMTGTHPFQKWKHRLISKGDRYEYIYEKYQWLARRMNVYGLHVHVGMPSGNRALAVSKAMVPYMPHLLALSANSPFWQGIDTGMQSSRISVMESFPFAGVPPHFADWEDLSTYCKTLYRAGAIQSLKDLYWFIRPNLSFGTIEFRICDTMTTLSETMALVALIHCLVDRVSERLDQNPNDGLFSAELHWIAPHNQWVAARDGVDGIIIADPKGRTGKISEGLAKLIEELTPNAQKLDCLEELQSLKAVLTEGNGACRQRAVYAESGSLRQVVDESCSRFRNDLLTVV